MASLLEKINTLINANLHSVVDRALEANSVKVMDEYIRQAERNLEALEDSAATVGGTVRTLKRKYEEFAAAAEKLDRDIDTLILRGKDELAAAAQTERDRLIEEARATKKPENIIEKIVEGRMKSFFNEQGVLEAQPFAKDESKTVAQVLADAKLKAKGFILRSIGS